MKLNIKKDLFCKMCSLQFDKKYVYDVHLSLVHKKFKSSTGRIQSRFDETVDEKENMDTIYLQHYIINAGGRSENLWVQVMRYY